MSKDDDARRHTQTIDATDTQYNVHVGGTVDGESLRDPIGYGNYSQAWENNLWTRLQNTGTEAVVNPWIHLHGRCHWHSIDSILEEILTPDMDDRGKALAIWEFARRHRYHSTTGDDEVKDTVKMLNVYGYTLCWDEAYTVSNLWQAAGLAIRRGLPHGHCTTEVFFDGGWHLLDSDEHLLVLGRDNDTIVDEGAISRDHDLMKRSHTYGVLSNEDRAGSEGAAALFCHDGPRTGTRAPIGEHRMDLTLRPGEAIVWGWDNRGRYHGYGDAPPRFCNGGLVWTPPLDASFNRWTDATEQAACNNGQLTADSLTWRLQAPYVLVGGRLNLRLSDAAVQAELSQDGRNWVCVARGLEGSAELDLDDHFPPAAPAAYAVYIRLSGAAFTLEHLHIELTLQMAPLSLPSLRVDDNPVVYADESTSRQVEVTHTWRERDDLTAPAAPRPTSPADGVAMGTTPTLTWTDTCGAGGDYHVRLGTGPDMVHTLSPVFDKLVSRTPSTGKPQWTVPEAGLLNPDTTYYWHVRARTAQGLWGPWSDVAEFTPQAPGVPLDVRLHMDWEHRLGTLRWLPNPQGTAPVRFEIYGSDERGFSISRQPYTIVAGTSAPGGRLDRPANYLFDVDATECRVVGVDLPAGNHAFYRVVSVDAEGVRSGPSDYAEAPRPFICTQPPTVLAAGSTTTVTLGVIRSMGDLRAESDGARRYQSAIRDGDNVSFVLDEGPDFISLDGDTGALTFQPQAHHASTHTVTVRVKNGQGGVDVLGFDIVITA